VTRPKALIVFAPGTNCDEEAVYCFQKAGAVADRVLVGDLFENRVDYRDYQILAFPGGFSYGDCIAAGRILANYLETRLADLVREFVEKDKLVIGICNGFQTLARLGVFNAGGGRVTLERNESLKFECRWVRMRVPQNTDTIFVRGITDIWMPIGHGEGRVLASAPAVMDSLMADGRVALQYAPHYDDETPVYPENPNGSERAVAGLTDTTKRIFGLMPHPERFLTARHCFVRLGAHPMIPADATLGMKVFQNAVGYFS
jgi:phosphoribosylformylglycinamidine synthase subunit PurQ / glutaminase